MGLFSQLSQPQKPLCCQSDTLHPPSNTISKNLLMPEALLHVPLTKQHYTACDDTCLKHLISWFESVFLVNVYALTSSPLASRWVSSFRLRIILSSLKSYGKVSVHSVSSWRTLGVIFRTLI